VVSLDRRIPERVDDWLDARPDTATTATVVAYRQAAAEGDWRAAADGGVFSFGAAKYLGGMGGKHLAAPIMGIDATRSGKGYWLVGKDGGVFSFGDAAFHGSAAGKIH
jgi:hypothetical protein